MKKLNVMSWNIWEGMGAQIIQGAALVDKARLDKIQSTLKQITPDVLVLNEALWCKEENGFYIDYKTLLGFEYSYQDLYDKQWGNIILSHHPIARTSLFRIYNRSGLRVTLENGLTVATYHPHPSRYPSHKAHDFQELLKECTGPTLVCGDFNAISPEDVVDEEALKKAFAAFSKTPTADVARFTEGGKAVFKTLKQLGFTDAVSVADRKATMPTEALNPLKDTAMRIDHAWFKDIRSCTAEVYDTPLTQWASDHLPLVVKIEM